MVLVGGLHEAALDDRALGGGAAHVERDQTVGAEDSREARAARDTGRGSRLDRVHGLRARRGERERPAVRLGHQDLPLETAPGQPLAEGTQVAVHDRLDVRVHDRRARPLVLAPFLRDAVRGRDRHARYLARDDLSGALLVGRVAIREQEHDRHRLHAVGVERAGGRPNRGFVERYEHVAGGRQPLGYLAAAPARHQRLGPPIEHVVHFQEIAAADLEHVPEPLGGDEPGARPPALEERVDPDRGAVDDESAVSQPDAGLIHLAWGPVEVDFALAVARSELDLRALVTVLYRSLRELGEGTLEQLLEMAEPRPLSPRATTAPVVSSSATRSVNVPPMSTPILRATSAPYRTRAGRAANARREADAHLAASAPAPKSSLL